MSLRSKITGSGMCVPNRVVTNEELSGLMDTSDEWIRQRTGIEERRWVSDGETPASLAREASLQAIKDAGITPQDIDCILLATLSPEHDFPGTSFFLHEHLDADEIPCFDLRAQCSGFLYGLSVADSLVRTEKFERVLVVGTEVHSTGLDVSTRGRGVTVIFGDGAGALVVEANRDDSDPGSLLGFRLHAEGRFAKKLWVEAPGCANRPRIGHEAVEDGSIYPQMDGRFVFKHAVTRMPEVIFETLSGAGIELEEVDLFLFHQANLRINEFVAKKLGIPEERVFSNIQRYGNCSAGSIPMLLAEAARNGMLTRGKLVCMTAFGSGFTWACALARW